MGNFGRVLIVEDDPEMVCLLTMLLEEEGFEVNHALGEDALILAERIKPNLIILDIMMPQMNGLEWSNRAKANLKIKNIPIIVLTAAGAHVLKNEFKFLQASCFVPKPFEIEQLLNLVYAFVSFKVTQLVPEYLYN